MSDDLTRGELTAALHELAAAKETPPAVGAPAVRRRAVRRGRRRRAGLTLGAGTAALALAAFALTLDRGDDTPAHRRIPAATAPGLLTSPAPAVTPVSGTVDFGKRALTVDGRVMPVLSAYPSRPFAGLLTVTARLDLTRDTADGPTTADCKVDEPYVIELRGSDRSVRWVGSLACPHRTASWINLDPEDAAWLYKKLRPGDTLSVAATPSA